MSRYIPHSCPYVMDRESEAHKIQSYINSWANYGRAYGSDDNCCNCGGCYGSGCYGGYGCYYDSASDNAPCKPFCMRHVNLWPLNALDAPRSMDRALDAVRLLGRRINEIRVTPLEQLRAMLGKTDLLGTERDTVEEEIQIRGHMRDALLWDPLESGVSGDYRHAWHDVFPGMDGSTWMVIGKLLWSLEYTWSESPTMDALDPVTRQEVELIGLDLADWVRLRTKFQQVVDDALSRERVVRNTVLDIFRNLQLAFTPPDCDPDAEYEVQKLLVWLLEEAQESKTGYCNAFSLKTYLTERWAPTTLDRPLSTRPVMATVGVYYDYVNHRDVVRLDLRVDATLRDFAKNVPEYDQLSVVKMGTRNLDRYELGPWVRAEHQAELCQAAISHIAASECQAYRPPAAKIMALDAKM